jgi:hypothetical protein
MATNCPSTQMVLGGMSQGAGVIDLIAIAAPVWRIAPVPMLPEAADHVAAVTVFGNPSRDIPGGGPFTALSPLYGPKTIDLCAPGDPFCSQGNDLSAHLSYVQNGMVSQAATFADSALAEGVHTSDSRGSVAGKKPRASVLGLLSAWPETASGGSGRRRDDCIETLAADVIVRWGDEPILPLRSVEPPRPGRGPHG